MAELKVHDYEFREPLESQPLDHSEPTTEKLPTDPQRPEVIRVPASPARRLESIFYLCCAFDIGKQLYYILSLILHKQYFLLVHLVLSGL